jgi:acetyltransferase-like isoleucine patch superfamily enzyme
MRKLLYLFAFLLPWALRRRLLIAVFGYTIDPTSHIGLAWVMPERLIMEPHSTIGTLTVCKGLKFLHLKQNSLIGRGNWITGFPLGSSKHFAHERDRQPELIMGEHSAITNRHIIDCTNRISVGAFATVAGFRSQILTHSVDLEKCRQSSAPVTIGDYAFVGTDCILLGGSSLPDHSVLGAKSLLNKQYSEPFWLYAGNPARPVDRLSEDMGYFKRQVGFVV